MSDQKQWTEQEVSQRLSNLFADDTPAADEHLVDAAAVLATFDVATIRPHGQMSGDLDAARTALASCAEQTAMADGRTRMTLKRDIRREALQRLLEGHAVADALAANPDREQDVMQHMLESVLTNPSEVPPLAHPEAVRAYQVVTDWVRGLMPDLPSPQKLQELADRATQLAPFHELVGEYFAGRTSELGQLADYVDILKPSGTLEAVTRVVRSIFSIVEEPPLFVFGPGGIGKSTLIAKFILDHVDNPRVPQFPYAYCDVDRPGLVAEEPVTLLIEALRQLAAQYPDHRAQLTNLQREWAAKIGASTKAPPKPQPPEPSSRQTGDSTSHLESSSISAIRRFQPIWSRLRLGERDYYIETFAHAVKALQPGRQPMLFVVDTFEEVQLRSAAHVSELFAFFDQLQRQLPFLRTVLCGRVPPPGYTVRELKLATFDVEAATAYLTARVRIDRQTAEAVARQVTRSPLTLKLAVDLLNKERATPGGSHDLGEILGDLRKGSVEAQLYNRVLRHISDPEVRKLAHPGLVLRRITPELIQKVLAGPCGLSVPDRETADRLFKKLRAEVVLVSERAHDVLVHRPDLRAVMLGPLRDSDADRVAEIQDAAIRYYETQPAVPEMRAEEVYHRLARGLDRSVLEARWIEGMEPYLTNAIPELSPRAQGFLAARLNLALDPAVWAQADVQDWERFAVRELREYLRVGRLDDALALLAQHKDFSSVELRMGQVETLARTGNLHAARHAAAALLEVIPPDSEEAHALREQLGASSARHERPDAGAAAPAGDGEEAEPVHASAVAEALADAYSQVDGLLDMLRRFGLSDLIAGLPPLSSFPSGREAPSVALHVAARAERGGQLATLVLAARRASPQNARLWSIADTLGLVAHGASDLLAIGQSILRGSRPGDLRAALTRLEAQMCLIAVDDHATTFSAGFLIGPDLVLTGAHMFAGPERHALRPRVTFDRWMSTAITMPGVHAEVAPDWLVARSEPDKEGDNDLGYAVIKLAVPVGEMPGADGGHRGWMPLLTESRVVPREAVATLRFDGEQRLQFSFSPDGMRDRHDDRWRLSYEIEGERGGAGSPIFDSHLRLVALHVSRGDQSWLATLTHRRAREGVPVDLIARDLAARGITLSVPDHHSGLTSDAD